jgi:hypothetical protein
MNGQQFYDNNIIMEVPSSRHGDTNLAWILPFQIILRKKQAFFKESENHTMEL